MNDSAWQKSKVVLTLFRQSFRKEFSSRQNFSQACSQRRTKILLFSFPPLFLVAAFQFPVILFQLTMFIAGRFATL
jgi:hypothetical protein